jgi:hypothetical protein
LKDDFKILVPFKPVQNLKVSHFLAAKVKKVNIAVTYSPFRQGAGTPFFRRPT